MNNKQIAQKLIELAYELDPDTTLKKTESEFWEIKIEKGTTIEGVLAECKKIFPVWRWTDDNLDPIVNSDRTSNKAYAVKVKASIEADENLKNLSANDLTAKGIKGITLLERLVLELQYFKETGKHLDIQNWTICSGSRDSGGRVPGVDWGDDELLVRWRGVGYSDDDGRAREVSL